MTCAALALAAPAIYGCGGSDAVVVRVGDASIAKSALTRWTAEVAAVDGPQSAARSASRRALGLLILSRWFVAEAREDGVGVSAREAKKQLQTLAFDERTHIEYFGALPRDPEMRTLLLSAKVRSHDRLWLMQVDLLAAGVERERVSQASREISHAEIADYYESHAHEFLVPKEFDMDILGSYQRPVVVKARREIEAGAPFLAVARRVSIDPEAPNGVQHLIQGHEERPFEDVIFAARPHVLVGPVQYGFYYLFDVFAEIPAHHRPLAEVEAGIRQKLAAVRASTTLQAEFEARWRARTACRVGYLLPQCAPRSTGA